MRLGYKVLAVAAYSATLVFAQNVTKMPEALNVTASAVNATVTGAAHNATVVAHNATAVAGNATAVVAHNATAVAGNATAAVAHNATVVAGNATAVVAHNATVVAGNATAAVAHNATVVAGNATAVVAGNATAHANATAAGVPVPVSENTTAHNVTGTVPPPFPGLRGSGVQRDEVEGLTGDEFLQGIKDIIGADPNLPRNEVDYKPFMGSFASVHNRDDPAFQATGHCLTDNACGHNEAYSGPGVPLSDLQCNKFCYIDRQSRRYRESTKYNVWNPPQHYLCCGWETCG